MSEKARVRVYIDKDLSNAADKIFEQLGLSATTDISIFFSRVSSTGQLPFELSESEYKENKTNNNGGVENG